MTYQYDPQNDPSIYSIDTTTHSNRHAFESTQRYRIHQSVQHALKPFLRNTTIERLKNNITQKVIFLESDSLLGKGEYGEVISGHVCTDATTTVPLAIKWIVTEQTAAAAAAEASESVARFSDPYLQTDASMQQQQQQIGEGDVCVVERILREDMAHALLNCLVFLKICPHFALVHRSFLSLTRNLKPQHNNHISSTAAADANKSSNVSLNKSSNSFFTSSSEAMYHRIEDSSKTIRTRSFRKIPHAANYSMRSAPQTTSRAAAIASAEPSYHFILCNERADGNAKEWFESIQGPVTAEHIVTFLTQMFVSIIAYTTHFDMVHNDLYLKNILYTKQNAPFTFVYNIHVTQNDYYTIALPNCDVLFTITDFGICSSPSHLSLDHMAINDLASSQQYAESLVELDYGHHVLEYKNIAPRVRDIVVLIKSLMTIKVLPRGCREWMTEILRMLDERCDGNNMSLRNLVFVILECLNPEFMVMRRGSNNGFSISQQSKYFYRRYNNHSKKSSDTAAAALVAWRAPFEVYDIYANFYQTERYSERFIDQKFRWIFMKQKQAKRQIAMMVQDYVQKQQQEYYDDNTATEVSSSSSNRSSGSISSSSVADDTNAYYYYHH